MRLLYVTWIITSLITHIWTTLIAFGHGFLTGVVSLFLPFISEIYWLIHEFRNEDSGGWYPWITLIALVLSIIFSIARNQNNRMQVQ